MKISAMIGHGLLGCLVFTGAWATGRAAISFTASDREPAPLSDEEMARRLAGVPLRGTLDPALHPLAPGRAGAPTLLLVVRHGDLRTCENLGHQLRELRREAFPAFPAIVLTDSVSAPTVRGFLKREKLPVPLHVLATVDRVLVGPGPLPSPAALLVEDGQARGIAFPSRVPGVRTSSFAQALAAAAAPTRSGASGGRTPTHPGGGAP